PGTRVRGGLDHDLFPIRPDDMQLLVVEAVSERRLDDVEIWREVEIARRVQRIVADMQDFAPGIIRLRRGLAGLVADLGQDRITYTLIGLRDQGGADGARRIAGAER